jgi:anti-sigma factor (TIGR02949 family)
MTNIESCREIVRQLWPFLDGVLPDEWQERVAAHLAECAACKSHYDFERAFLDAIRSSQPNDDEFAVLRDKVLIGLGAEGMQF